ncbi:hypothetical protein Tco_0674063 [Tanacetum coccineum]
MPKKTSDTFHSSRVRELGDNVNFSSVDVTPPKLGRSGKALWESGKYLKSHRGNNRMGFRESFRAILVMKGSGKWYLVRVASFKLSVVDAHSPPCVQSCRIDHFPAIFDNGHATLLWYTMHRAYPWTVRDWINQSGVKKLFNFFLDDVVDFWIYPPLDACENRLVISPLP